MYDPLMVDTFMSVYHELPDESAAPAFHTVEKDTTVGIRPPRSYRLLQLAIYRVTTKTRPQSRPETFLIRVKQLQLTSAD